MLNNCDNFVVEYKRSLKVVRKYFFLFILKVANIRCIILIKCSEQEARFKKYVIMSYLMKMILMYRWNRH
jgi:hypothetical protein